MGRQSGGVRNSYLQDESAGYERILQAKAVLKIRQVFADIDKGGRPVISQPFAIGKVDKEIKDFASERGIKYGSGFIYMNPNRIKHSLRDSKPNEIKISRDDLASFPLKYHNMDIYYQIKSRNIVYTDYKNKFVVSPRYNTKIKKSRANIVLYITASKVNNTTFNTKEYIKIKEVIRR